MNEDQDLSNYNEDISNSDSSLNNEPPIESEDNQNNDLNILDVLAIVSVILQIKGYQNDMSQSSNDDLMRELQRQDRTYLEKIIEKQEEILQRLAELG